MQWPPPKQQAASNSQCRPLQQQTLEENRETVDEVVPIVVRPGHIRFEPAGTMHLPSTLLPTSPRR